MDVTFSQSFHSPRIGGCHLFTVQFLIPAPLADKVWAACAGIYDPAQLVDRVFMSWLNGAPLTRETRTASWKLNVLKHWAAAKQKG